MKSLLDQKDLLSTTTTKVKNKLQIKENFNNYSFNHIDRLCLGHDVTVSNTMIKITYKKALKDQNAGGRGVNCNSDLNFNIGKNKPPESTNLSSSRISFIVTSPKVETESNNKGLSKVFHSTPKQPGNEKKKKFINGINLSAKPDNLDRKSSVDKIHKTSQENVSSSPKKSKGNKEFDKKLGKANNLVKPKISIRKKNSDIKKTKLSNEKKKLEKIGKKEQGKKIPKIETLKRKASNPEINNLGKKPKIGEQQIKKEENRESLQEAGKTNGKKQIMLVDPDLPSGWTRFIRTKNKGSPNEQYVVYVVNPQGKKFRFKWKLRKYLQRTNSSLDADQFFFGLYQRPKTFNPSTEEEKSREVRLSDHRREFEHEDSSANADESSRNSDGREILFFDPDLPFGWKRIIHSNNANGRKQVHIISPDGKIFRRRYRLHEYLIKHQYTHNLDRFYFGLYPKKEGSNLENLEEKMNGFEKDRKVDDFEKVERKAVIYNRSVESENENEGDTKADVPNSPLYDDPKLPEGWKRFIKIRSCGESAGRMEVVIVSPDGRRHRSRKHLHHYLTQKQLNYKAVDFDFTVFGRSNLKRRLPPTSVQEPESETEPDSLVSSDRTFAGTKRKFSDKPVPELDINSLKEPSVTAEGRLINTVNGLMMCSGLSSARNERRQRLPRGEHEKQLRSHLNSESEISWNGCSILTCWVQRLVKCRADFRNLEPDAVATIAETTQEFIKKVSVEALAGSDQQGNELRYEDLAELVDRTNSLSFLKNLIPKKITFREFIKLNRPKQFMSFT